jgi:hypothetical protein
VTPFREPLSQDLLARAVVGVSCGACLVAAGVTVLAFAAGS